MIKHTTGGPLRGSGPGGSSHKAVPDDISNMRLLIVAAAFLLVAIALIILQPRAEPLMPVAALPVENGGDEGDGAVTRGNTSMFEAATESAPEREDTTPPLPKISSAEAVSKTFIVPLRLTAADAAPRDLRGLTEQVLAGLGYRPVDDDPFVALLVQALSERQSDAYFDALVNTAYVRGDIAPPAALLTLTGRVDVPSLLQAMVMASEGYTPAFWPAAGAEHAHGLGRGDSLVGLALRYYRQPQKHTLISKENGVENLAQSHTAGDVLTIPAL